jgi:haloalkane dehalogenase
MTNVSRWSAILPSLGLAAACGGAGDSPRTDLERHVDEFRASNPYEEHDVPRGPYHVAARRFSPGAEGGPPVLLLHGYPDSQHLYDEVIPILAREREVVSFDFLGWGASDKPDPADHVYDAASLRADLEAVIDHFGYDRMTLVVHDASGWPGIDWALENPERVAALVILNTVYHPTATARPPEGLAQYAASGAARDAMAERALADDDFWLDGTDSVIGYRDQIGAFFASSAARDHYLPVLAEESLQIRPAFFALAARLFPEVIARGPAIPRMGAFDRPVTVAFGVEDPYLNLGVAADFASRFPRSQRRDIAGANHYVQLDQPGAVAAAILAADRPGN